MSPWGAFRLFILRELLPHDFNLTVQRRTPDLGGMFLWHFPSASPSQVLGLAVLENRVPARNYLAALRYWAFLGPYSAFSAVFGLSSHFGCLIELMPYFAPKQAIIQLI